MLGQNRSKTKRPHLHGPTAPGRIDKLTKPEARAVVRVDAIIAYPRITSPVEHVRHGRESVSKYRDVEQRRGSGGWVYYILKLRDHQVTPIHLYTTTVMDLQSNNT